MQTDRARNQRTLQASQVKQDDCWHAQNVQRRQCTAMRQIQVRRDSLQACRGYSEVSARHLDTSRDVSCEALTPASPYREVTPH